MKTKVLISFSILLTAIFLFNSCLKDDETRTFEDGQKELEAYVEENNITTAPMWTGLYYIETDTGSGVKAKNFDTVSIEYKASRLDGYVLASSEKDGEPLTFQVVNNNIIKGVNLAVTQMNKGAKAKVIMPSTLAFYSSGLENLEPFSALVYEIEMLDIKPGIEVDPYDVDGLTLNTTSSGLKYYIVRERSGDQIYRGYNVSLHYTGYDSEGTIFDSSVKKGEPQTMQVGLGQLIDGWDEGILLMKEGEKFRFIIPPDLAYGVYGNYPYIKSNDTLTFDVEAIEIVK
jgi:peptidylprolyl isomerase